MLAYMVTLHDGRRYTVRAAELRYGYDGGVELLADTPAGKQTVALFSANEVESVIAREFLISEEPGEPKAHVVDPIPF